MKMTYPDTYETLDRDAQETVERISLGLLNSWKRIEERRPDDHEERVIASIAVGQFLREQDAVSA